MNSDKNLFFSSEIAETLGLECAIILNQYNENLLDDTSTLEGLLRSTKKNLSFLDEKKMQYSVLKNQ